MTTHEVFNSTSAFIPPVTPSGGGSESRKNHPWYRESPAPTGVIRQWIEKNTGRKKDPSNTMIPIESRLKESAILDSIVSPANFNDGPQLYRYFAMGHRKKIDSGSGETISAHGIGTSPFPFIAREKAIGELLERHFLFDVQGMTPLVKSVRECERKNLHFLHPKKLLHTDSRKSAKEFPEDLPISWVIGEAFPSKKKVYVSAQMVFWAFTRAKNEPFILESNTNGGGGGFSKEQARLSGLYELIERDAFLTHWLLKHNPPRIDFANCADQKTNSLLEIFDQPGFEVAVLDTTTDIGVPSVSCVLTDDSGESPVFAVSGASAWDSLEAVRKGLCELASLYHPLRANKRDFALPKEYAPFTDFTIGRVERLQLWATGEETFLRDFMGGKKLPFASFIAKGVAFLNTSQQLTKSLEAIKYCMPDSETLFFDIPRSLTKHYHYCVSKTLNASLQPLYLVEGNAIINEPRLAQVAKHFGLAGADDINPLPHPFP